MSDWKALDGHFVAISLDESTEKFNKENVIEDWLLCVVIRKTSPDVDYTLHHSSVQCRTARVMDPYRGHCCTSRRYVAQIAINLISHIAKEIYCSQTLLDDTIERASER